MYDPRQQSYTKAEYDALRVELAKHKEVIEYAAAMDKQATLGILELEANFKAKDERIKEIQEHIRKNSGHHLSCGKIYGRYACTCGFEQALKEE